MQRELGYWLPTHIALSETVQGLVDMRRDGPNATFGQQFFRTINLRSSDPRDKAFGLLGVSSFPNDDRTITADYNKSISQVSTETTVAILKSNFASYIKYQPWKHAEAGNWWDTAAMTPTWTINLRFISDARKADPYTTLYETDLITAIARTQGIAPIIEFSDDQRSISTVGTHLGHLISIDDPIPRSSMQHGDSPPYLSNLSTALRSTELNISGRTVMAGLLGPYSAQALDYEASISELKTLVRESQVGFGPLTAAMKDMYSSTGVAFLTSQGGFGVYYRAYEEREEEHKDSLVVAALFGIRLPFILKQVDGGRYKLWALAHVGDHTLGDGDVEALGPDGEWRDLVKQGKMEEFVIV